MTKLFLKKYINNISSLQAFQLLRFGTLLLINIVFAKSGISKSSIGDYEMFLFIALLFCSFWIIGLIQSFLPLYRNSNTFKTDENKSPEIFNVFVLIVFFSVLAVSALLIFKNILSDVLTESSEIPYFGLLLIYLLLSNPTFLIEYIYLLKNKPNAILKYGSISFLFQLIFVSVPVLLGYGIKFSLYGLIFVSGLRLIWLIILLKKYTSLKLSFNFIKEHLYVGYPLILTTLLGSSATYIDNFLVLNNFDASTFATFRYGAKEFPVVLLMANALSTAMIPRIARKEIFLDSLEVIRKKSKNLMHILFPVTILILLFSKWLYPIVFSPEFTESAIIFNIYLLLIISRLVFPHTILIGLKKTNVVLYASLAELIINVFLSILFINLWGIEGVAFATLIAFAVQKIICLIYNQIALGISAKKYIPAKLLILYSIIMLIIFYVVY